VEEEESKEDWRECANARIWDEEERVMLRYSSGRTHDWDNLHTRQSCAAVDEFSVAATRNTIVGRRPGS